jgi:hypothetical protein
MLYLKVLDRKNSGSSLFLQIHFTLSASVLFLVFALPYFLLFYFDYQVSSWKHTKLEDRFQVDIPTLSCRVSYQWKNTSFSFHFLKALCSAESYRKWSSKPSETSNHLSSELIRLNWCPPLIEQKRESEQEEMNIRCGFYGKHSVCHHHLKFKNGSSHQKIDYLLGSPCRKLKGKSRMELHFRDSSLQTKR